MIAASAARERIMAEKKSRKSKKMPAETILDLQAPKYVGYLDCVLGTPIVLKVRNGYEEAIELRLELGDGEGLLVPYRTSAQVPFESTVSVTAQGVFSPLFLAENAALRTVTVTATAAADGAAPCSAEAQIGVLPYDFWEGLEGNAERLACFVRPRVLDCGRILEDAGKRMRRWGDSSEVLGYAASDKNTVRKVAAAVYAALKDRDIEKAEEGDLSRPCRAFSENLLKGGKASPLELALFAAACFEAAQLHPVIAVGKNAVGVGVWLYDACFLDTVTDDAEIVGKYISEGINNLSFFDVEDLFSSKNIGFTPSEAHFAEKLKEGYFEVFTDVHRCRAAGLLPLPLKTKGLHGSELVSETSGDSAPAPLPEYKALGIEGKLPKNRQWERRLLDLTTKNALLNFTGKNALHARCGDPDALRAVLSEGRDLTLKEGGSEKTAFGMKYTAAERELIVLEHKNGILRVYADGETLSETARALARRNREADEESGARILYLALGFLQYVSKEDGKPKYAPLVLAPVRIGRAKGNEEFSVSPEGTDIFVNSTLLEFLKQEFNIDVRGLASDISALKLAEVFAMVRAETAGMKGWTVVQDAYLATFSFQRYLMWNDLHTHFDELGSNAVVSALLNNRPLRAEFPVPREEDDADPAGTLIPLPADSSQYSAIALSRTGASFVLHGPPGTGKSQTITNMIANALEDGKRVLFVAEKKAALDVVKKRLDAIGIGDFCLELHGGKTDKADVVRRLEHTLSLAGGAETDGFPRGAEEVRYLREELKKPMLALHRKRRLGISVYEAILLYLKNKDAPDVMDIESAFYDTLSERKLAECKNKILSAAAAAKECGGVFNSPFDNVYTTEYSQELRDKIFCASEVLLTEIKHLKAFLGLFLEFYRQRLSAVTQKKLDNIRKIASDLAGGVYAKYFTGVTQEEFYVFYNANRRLDENLAFYSRHFKSIVDLGKDREEIKKIFEQEGDVRRTKVGQTAIRKLLRAAYHPLDSEDAVKFLQILVEIHDSVDLIGSSPLAKNFLDRGGDIVYKRRTEYLSALYGLHDLAAQTFLDYNPDAFNDMCLRAQSGYTLPVLEGYLKAEDAFLHAQESFLAVTKANRDKLRREDVLDYFTAKAGALIDNIDMLSNWCMYRKTGEVLSDLGCNFVTEALESGRLTSENVLAGFEKNVYKNFLEINLPADPDLSRMTAGTLEDTVEKFRLAWEAFAEATRGKIRSDLISRLPSEGYEGSLAVEVASFRRLAKSNLRGTGLRALFSEIPELMGRISPCLLLSPVTAAQYLRPQADLYDLVIFDEASQMTTAEAVGSIARAKAAIVVGDPRQLPPTAFFKSAYVDEENLENEDLESILDDCLALGMPERHLLWHYRSKHESLIAFSNSMYYDNKLCTVPSPDALESKVRFRLVDGTYDRGFTKRNQKEAEALVKEIVARLLDPVLSRSSMGVVTFSSAQQLYIERLLGKEIAAKKLEAAAYDREEPLFVKNLENVQGDERDVILFSVCYGPDPAGRVSLNFGPLNQSGGWRRLNVAVSRAREEMIVFSSMTAGMIDLQKTTSKGVAGLKAFLEFAERGKTTLAVRPASVRERQGMGKYLAEELRGYGYHCRVDVGASDFKIDVAVLDPAKGEFILAILFDGEEQFSLKDRNILQVQALKRSNWNVLRVNSVNYYNNPKREVKRIKELLDKLTGTERKRDASLAKYARPYRAVKTTGAEVAAFVTCGENDAAVSARLKEIVALEEPISRSFLKARCLATFGIAKPGARLYAKLDELIDGCSFRRERVNGTDYYYKTDRAVAIGRFRTEKDPVLRREEDLTPFEIVSYIKALLEDRVSVYLDELLVCLAGAFRVRRTERLAAFVRDCIAYGEQKGILVRSVSDRIALA